MIKKYDTNDCMKYMMNKFLMYDKKLSAIFKLCLLFLTTNNALDKKYEKHYLFDGITMS